MISEGESKQLADYYANKYGSSDLADNLKKLGEWSNEIQTARYNQIIGEWKAGLRGMNDDPKDCGLYWIRRK
jgi:hypothetical protein